MHFKVSSAICFSLDQSKVLPSGNGLKKMKRKVVINDLEYSMRC